MRLATDYLSPQYRTPIPKDQDLWHLREVMPGVPPNALSKLKSALKGMLKGGNKQKKQGQQEQKKPTAAANATPATTSTSAAAPAAAAPAAAAPVAAASTSTQPSQSQGSAPAPAELKAETAPEPVVAGGPEGSQVANEEVGSKSAVPVTESTSTAQQTDASTSKATESTTEAPKMAASEEKIVAEPAKVDGAAEDATGTTAGTHVCRRS